MYPKYHVVIAAFSTALYGLASGLDPVTLVLWIVVGTFVGVFIDVDHAILGMFIGESFSEGLSWFRKPLEALRDPDAFLDDVEYDGMRVHRLLSHLIILFVLAAMLPIHPLIVPAVVGLSSHIAADVAWDLYEGGY